MHVFCRLHFFRLFTVPNAILLLYKYNSVALAKDKETKSAEAIPGLHPTTSFNAG